MPTEEEVLRAHSNKKGKIEVISKVPIRTKEELSTYYTPGVAYVAAAIKENKEKVYDYTNKANMIAIISDGTRLLGLGNVGPYASMPVMEGKAVLFKKLGGVDAVPLCINTTNEDEIVEFAMALTPSFGAINIEDIESPKALSIVKRLSMVLDIPVFHDDQQGTGVVVLAALINALKLAGKGKECKIVIVGAGSAGIGISKLLSFAGFKNIYVIDSAGAIYMGRKEHMNQFKEEVAQLTNKELRQGQLYDIAKDSDVLIGVSSIRNSFSRDLIMRMNEKPIVFALTNPEPEISYSDAKEAGAFVVATGRSDSPNQVNNVKVFPGFARGLLEVRAKEINEEMLYSAATALSKTVGNRLSIEYILPDITDSRQALKATTEIAAAVAESAIKAGVARLTRSSEEVKKDTTALIKRYASIEKKILGK